MLRPLAVAALLVLVAGCGTPTPAPPATPVQSPAPSPTYDVTVRVSEETADGPAIPRIEVMAYELSGAGGAGAAGLATARMTDGEGVVHYSFSRPVRLAVRASAPGWTREAAVVDVGDTVRSEQAAVSERDLFLPLYRSRLGFTVSTTLSTALVIPGNGTMGMPLATAPLDLPAAAKAGYLARLSQASIALDWEDTATSRADLAAGLAWDGAAWVTGEPSGPGLGARQATFAGPLPGEGRPSDLAAARLQAAAVLHSASIGPVPVTWSVNLLFSGQEPAGLPAPCHSTGACLPLPRA